MSEMNVSVIIPSYNCGEFVCQAVDSALAQTYPRIEVIVIDDGSTDDTRERLLPYGERIRYIYQQNRGLSAARNTGIREARGEWIALLDADDVWHPQKTALQIDAACKCDAFLIGSRPADVLPKSLAADPTTRTLNLRDFLVSAPIGPSGTMIHRRCFQEVGLFDETLRSIEDRDMWLRIATRFKCLQLDSPCWWYRLHQGQMSRRAGRMYENYRRVLDKFFAEHPGHRELRSVAYSYLYADTAWTFFAEGDRWAATRYLVKSLCRYPGRFGGAGSSAAWPRAKELVRYLFGDRWFQTFCSRATRGPTNSVECAPN